MSGKIITRVLERQQLAMERRQARIAEWLDDPVWNMPAPRKPGVLGYLMHLWRTL